MFPECPDATASGLMIASVRVFIYKSPNCISSKKIKNNYFNDNKVIDHSKNNWKPPLDPFDKFAKPDNNDSILYPDNYLEDMINQHETHNQNKILNRK